MGTTQSSSSASPSSASPSSASPSSASQSSASSASPLSLSPLTPSNMCEYSKKQVDKIIRETEELNISRDQKIGLHPDFKKQLADANATLKRMPESDNNIQFVANMQTFDEKHALLEDERMLQFPLIVKYILCCEVAHILKAYKILLEEIVKLCSKCQIERDVQNVDAQVNIIMDKFQEANRWFLLFSAIYKKGDIGGDGYGTVIHEALVESTTTIHDMFKNPEKVKDDMKEMCRKREELIGLRGVVFKGAAMGGNRLRSKKRKQMKMKMKSSNYRSKTRNSKKKYNRKSVKK